MKGARGDLIPWQPHPSGCNMNHRRGSTWLWEHVWWDQVSVCETAMIVVAVCHPEGLSWKARLQKAILNVMLSTQIKIMLDVTTYMILCLLCAHCSHVKYVVCSKYVLHTLHTFRYNIRCLTSQLQDGSYIWRANCF